MIGCGFDAYPTGGGAYAICAVLRRGEVVIPRGNVRLEVDDEVLALSDAESLPALAALFGPPH